MKKIKKQKKYKNTISRFKIFCLIIFISIYVIISHYFSYFFPITKANNEKLGNFYFDEDYPENYERHILDKIKHRFSGPTLMEIDEYYFVNGLIRKYKPKKLLEIGVCSGGMSANILNAISDIKGSFLYSCDLETKNYIHSNYEIGSVVKNNFPEFLNKWKLYTGNTTAAFIEEIGGDIDFVYIDTAHVMPGEVLNMIEIFPFLKKGAIIGFDDIEHQARIVYVNIPYIYSCNNLLFLVLRGKKIIFGQKKDDIFEFRKQGAVILDDNQEKYFFEYFYLLTYNWSYMPNKFEIDAIRKIVEKYYKPFFLSMFDKSVMLNYEKLKRKGLLKKDYILYTFIDSKRQKPFS